MPEGKYIVLEGGEGVGKTTQLALLKARLEANHIHCVAVREPGGTQLAESIRVLLLNGVDDWLTEAMLFNAARRTLMVAMRYELERGTWVLADRCYLSTLVYQGHARQRRKSEQRQLQSLCNYAMREISQTILLLDMPYVATQERLVARGAALDAIEQRGREFHQRVLEGYRIEASKNSLPIIDATKSIEEVHEAIWAHVQPLLPKEGEE